MAFLGWPAALAVAFPGRLTARHGVPGLAAPA